QLAGEVKGTEQERREPRVPSDGVDFVRRKSLRLGERCDVDGDLSQVVELGRCDKSVAFGVGDADEVEKSPDVRGDAFRVLARRGITLVDHVCQRLERLRCLVPKLLEPRLRPVEGGKKRSEQRKDDPAVRPREPEGYEDPEATLADRRGEIFEHDLLEEL